MRNRGSLFALLIIFSWATGFLASCADRKVNATINETGNTDTLVAYIDRTPCFGRCPYYSIRIYISGYVVYEGYDHVKNIGRFYTWLDTGKVQSIVQAANEHGYFELNNEYRNPHLTDFPTIYTEIHDKQRVKKITHYDADPPGNLVYMEDFIDGLFNDSTVWLLHPVQEIKE